MTALNLLDLIQTEDTKVFENTVFVNGVATAILVPATFVYQDESGGLRFYGPKGISEVIPLEKMQIWTTLVAIHSLLFGTPDEVDEVQSLLKHPATSRTCSFFCSISSDCAQVIFSLKKIRSSRILVLGLGGIGSLSSMVLAGAGIKALTIVDHDLVELSNFNRQLFFKRADVGKHKVDVIANAIADRHDGIEVIVEKNPVGAQNIKQLLTDIDFVLVSADDPLSTASMVFQHSRELKIPALSCGYTHGDGVVVYQSANAGAATEPKPKMIEWERIPNSIMPSFGPTNVELAGIVCGMLLLGLANQLQIKESEFSGMWRSREFPRVWDVGL